MRTSYRWVIVVCLLLFCIIPPFFVSLFVDFGGMGTSNPLFLANPFMFLEAVYDDRHYTYLVFSTVWAIIAFLLCSKTIFRQYKSFAPMQRKPRRDVNENEGQPTVSSNTEKPLASVSETKNNLESEELNSSSVDKNQDNASGSEG
jgi:hypothetical protein